VLAADRTLLRPQLYTRKRFDSLPDQSPPEIVRVPLQQLCLSIKAMGIHDVNTFLQRVCFYWLP
jgi:ATP-dependent RNA helicase DHX57